MHQIDDPFYANILKNATFLVTRNDLYVQINFEATREYAYYNNQPLIYSCTQDSYNHNILTENNSLRFLATSDTKDNAVCGILPLFINMKVVITINICANDNLANAIIDLTGSNTSNGLYMMLSLVQRLNDLLILQPFDESILNMRISPALYAEFDRLDECAQRTAQLKE
ncbi:5301_t:CDS:2 [Cetraspora pellucida]|uniref:5301_t:CDS:1 n=1 Tax=Cetraspora pellucida TaxID=1433469 RepID=A0A9N8VUX8_9GLOM|nr:5301_t:CDS:2 [Cetraspora pellucida]